MNPFANPFESGASATPPHLQGLLFEDIQGFCHLCSSSVCPLDMAMALAVIRVVVQKHDDGANHKAASYGKVDDPQFAKIEIFIKSMHLLPSI